MHDTSETPRDVVEHRLTIVPDELQAEMVRALLEDGGIACVVRRTTASGLDWGSVNVGMGGAREIIVDAANADAARGLLERSGADAPVHDHDEALLRRGRRLRVGFAAVMLVVFGLPIAYGIASTVLGIGASTP